MVSPDPVEVHFLGGIESALDGGVVGSSSGVVDGPFAAHGPVLPQNYRVTGNT